MRKFTLLLALIGMLGFTQCINETYFGESEQANITKFTIEGELTNKIEPLVDWKDVGTVTITVPESYDLSNLTVTAAVCSQLAHFETDPLTIHDFSKDVELNVHAEKKGIVKKWIIKVSKEVVPEEEELAFSNMQQWTPKNNQGISVVVNGKEGSYPGNGVDYSPWNSSIESNKVDIGGFKDLTTFPYDLSDGTKCSRIQTIKSTSLIAINMGMGLASGAMFVGEFIFNQALMVGTVKEPRKMMNLGVSFHSKPKAVKFKMRYKPGPVMMDGKTVPITTENADGRPTKDGCDIYFLLQNRKMEANTFVRIAGASYRSERGANIGDMGDDASGFVVMEIPFIYGEPTAEELAEKPYCGIGGLDGDLFFYEFTPTGDGKYDISKDPVKEVYAQDPNATEITHIVALFSSSVNGDKFWAAPESMLDIKDIELVY